MARIKATDGARSIIAERVRTDERAESFGVFDRRGREIGARARCYTVTYAPEPAGAGCCYAVAPGVYFELCRHALRAGEPFGPGFDSTLYATAEERDAAVALYFKGARRRALVAAERAAQRGTDGGRRGALES